MPTNDKKLDVTSNKDSTQNSYYFHL